MTAQALLTIPVLDVGTARVRPGQCGVAIERVPRPTWVLCAGLLLCGSILVSAVTTTDTDWWHLYFSRLGMRGDFSSLAFNSGLFFSGAIIAGSSCVLRMRLRDLGSAATRVRMATAIVPQAVTGLGVSLLAIGLFPLSVDPTAHEWATNGAVLSFTVLLIAHRALLWQLSASLRRATLLNAIVMIWALAAVKAEAISLTVFEVVVFAVILCWVHRFEHVMRSGATDRDHDGSTPPLALATTMPRREVANPSSISRSSAAPTSAPNASAPGSSMMPDASPPVTTGSNPRSSTSRDTTSRSSPDSPAIAIALRPDAPAGRDSSSRSWYPMCPSPFTTRAPARCR